MSELDQLYQEFYTQVTAKIADDFELFKNDRPGFKEKAIIKEFKDKISKTTESIIASYEYVEVNKIDYGLNKQRNETSFRHILVSQFRHHQKETYDSNPMGNFLQHNLDEITKKARDKSIENEQNSISLEGGGWIIPPNKELVKIIAAVNAYDDFNEKLSPSLQDQTQFSKTMPVKQTLRKWLADGENDRVVDALQTIANKFGDKYFVNNVTSIAGRFNGIKRDRQKGVISDEFYNIQLNQIRQALQDVIEDVPANATLDILSFPDDSTGTTPLGNTGNVTQPKSVDPQPKMPTIADDTNKPPTTNANIPWIVGLVLLIGATLLAAIIPCPSPFLSNATQILLAVGAAGIATILPGLFSIDVQGIKAGSAIGVFALVYLVNPAKAMEDNSRCNKEPFEFTINLQPNPEINISNQYPKLENATLQIWTGNDWKPAAIDANNLARYFSLPGDYKNQKVAVKLIGKYWSLKADSVQLSGRSQTLTIAPDGKLGKIEGKVRSTDGTIFLPGVAIEIEGVLDTTDTRGGFAIQIPPDKQKTRYLYTAQKKGYASETEPFDFDGEPIEIRLKK